MTINRIYISGAITGTYDYVLRFADAEQRLRDNGWEPINPARVCATLPPLSHEEYMIICIALMAACRYVYVLPDSGESVGVQQEIAYARDHGLGVFHAPLLPKYMSYA